MRPRARATRSKRLQIERLEPRIALSADPVLNQDQVAQLLNRAANASASEDAIIAVVDRNGQILGVRVESQVHVTDMVFAVDGAVAEARGAALFSSNQGDLTSRTVAYVSQSTIAQREVESNPSIQDPNSTIGGPGLVAAIGLGGHFPPGIEHTPVVDLFEIELTNRTPTLVTNPDDNALTPDDIMNPGAVSYGVVSGMNMSAKSRGIGTLPGGIPLYENGALVGAIGVFFPGPDGYATYEQGFVPGINQTSEQRMNAPRALEAEWIAFAAAGGSSGAGASVGALGGIPPLAGFDLPGGPNARIDLGGITLQSVGPIAGPLGFQAIKDVGAAVGQESAPPVYTNPNGTSFLDGKLVPVGWIVPPKNGVGITSTQVGQIINQGLIEASDVRSQLRLPIGQSTRMVFAVSDLNGNIVGLYRMPDAPVFSIDVAVAKARNTAYYANPAQLQTADMVDDNGDGIPDLPPNVAMTNRTFRFLAEARYPSGVDGSLSGAFSILRDPGINPATAENIGAPLPASAYTSVLGYAAFHPSANFHAPTAIQNQNGVVFFPGSTPIYQANQALAGGFGVSGDGVNQDDVVTFYGAANFQAPDPLRADAYFVRNVRLPFQNFSRNPQLPTSSPPPDPSDPPAAPSAPASFAFTKPTPQPKNTIANLLAKQLLKLHPTGVAAGGSAIATAFASAVSAASSPVASVLTSHVTVAAPPTNNLVIFSSNTAHSTAPTVGSLLVGGTSTSRQSSISYRSYSYYNSWHTH